MGKASHLKETCSRPFVPIVRGLPALTRRSPTVDKTQQPTLIFFKYQRDDISIWSTQSPPQKKKHVNTSALQRLAHRSSLCRKKISALSRSQTRWSTTAARQHVHRRYKSGRSFPCKQKGTHRADHRSCHRILEQVHLKEDGKTNRGINTTWKSFLCVWLCRQPNYA